MNNSPKAEEAEQGAELAAVVKAEHEEAAEQTAATTDEASNESNI